MRPVIQSFKKVINHAPASITAGTNTQYTVSNGVDSVAAGQTSAIDFNVPTGALIKYIEFQYVAQNLVNIANFVSVAIQQTRTGQSAVAPLGVGGSAQRNQVFHQDYLCVGLNQNVNRTYKFKVPKRFQRVREGDQWKMSVNNSAIITGACQIVYKFYR